MKREAELLISDVQNPQNMPKLRVGGGTSKK